MNYNNICTVISSIVVQIAAALRLANEFDVTRLAVRVVAVFLEGPLVEKFEAEGAGEVLWVPFLPHGSDTLAYRGRGGRRSYW